MSTSEAKKAARDKFEAVFEKIRDELVNHLAQNGMPSEAIEWYRNVSDFYPIFPSEYCC